MDDDITLKPYVTIAKQVEAMIQQLRSVSKLPMLRQECPKTAYAADLLMQYISSCLQQLIRVCGQIFVNKLDHIPSLFCP